MNKSQRARVIKQSSFDTISKTQAPTQGNGLIIFRGNNPSNLQAFTDTFKTDFFSIVRVVSGKAEVKINLTQLILLPNTLVVTTPNDLLQIITIDDDFIQEGVSFTSNFLLNVPVLKDYIEVMDFFAAKLKSVWNLLNEEGQLISYLITKLKQRETNLESNHYGNELLMFSFAEMLFEIAQIGRNYIASGDLTYGHKEELVIRFSRLAIQYHTTEKKLSFYSERLFVTSKYLSEVTKQITGQTAGHMIDDLDTMEAKRLLESTDLTVAEVSDRLNFSNPAFFSRFFKRMTGYSPLSYRSNINR